MDFEFSNKVRSNSHRSNKVVRAYIVQTKFVRTKSFSTLIFFVENQILVKGFRLEFVPSSNFLTKL